jgi:hypothetical protein
MWTADCRQGRYVCIELDLAHLAQLARTQSTARIFITADLKPNRMDTLPPLPRLHIDAPDDIKILGKPERDGDRPRWPGPGVYDPKRKQGA